VEGALGGEGWGATVRGGEGHWDRRGVRLGEERQDGERGAGGSERRGGWGWPKATVGGAMKP